MIVLRVVEMAALGTGRGSVTNPNMVACLVLDTLLNMMSVNSYYVQVGYNVLPTGSEVALLGIFEERKCTFVQL